MRAIFSSFLFFLSFAIFMGVAHADSGPQEGHAARLHFDGANNPGSIPFAVKAADVFRRMGKYGVREIPANAFDGLAEQCERYINSEIDYWALADWFIQAQNQYDKKLDDHYRELVDALNEEDRQKFEDYAEDLSGIDYYVVDMQAWFYDSTHDTEPLIRSRCLSGDFSKLSIENGASDDPDTRVASTISMSCSGDGDNCLAGEMALPWETGQSGPWNISLSPIEQMVRDQFKQLQGREPTESEVAQLMGEIQSKVFGDARFAPSNTTNTWELGEGDLRDIGITARKDFEESVCGQQEAITLSWPRQIESRKFETLKMHRESEGTFINTSIIDGLHCAQDAELCEFTWCWSPASWANAVMQLVYKDSDGNKYRVLIDDVKSLLGY